MVGAIVGGTFGFCLSMWLGIGKYVSKQPDERLSTSTSGCFANLTAEFANFTFSANNGTMNNITEISEYKLTGIEQLYSLSYLWLSVLGILCCVLLGLIVSLITGPSRKEDIEDRLLINVFGCCSRRCGRNQIYTVRPNEYGSTLPQDLFQSPSNMHMKEDSLGLKANPKVIYSKNKTVSFEST